MAHFNGLQRGDYRPDGSASTVRHHPPAIAPGRFSGDPKRARDSGRPVTEWVREVQECGAGDIVLNGRNAAHMREGYDLGQLATVRSRCHVPPVTSGSAGTPAHFREVFAFGADVARAASAFHSGALEIRALKHYLQREGVGV